MDFLSGEAGACWSTFGEPPYTDFAFDEEKFTELVRQSYQHITDPKESIYYTEDQDEDVINFTCGILAEQAVLDNNMVFFEKILAQCDLTDYNEHFFLAVAKTKRWEFFNKLLETNTGYQAEDYLYGLKREAALAAITCFEVISTPEEQFYGFVRRFALLYQDSLGLCMAFLEKGVPLQKILDYALRELHDLLLQEEV